MLTTFNEIDMSGYINLRNEYGELFLKKHSIKLGFMSGFVKASSLALKD
jgi:2-oxoglutarate dehydrogenase E2 component (dihydrolipoamide succinyltransferase)